MAKKVAKKSAPLKKRVAPKKKAAKKRAVVAKKITRSKRVRKNSQNYINALQYMVDSDERGIRLMVANSMGLISE